MTEKKFVPKPGRVDFALDWEAQTAMWFSFEEAKKLQLLPGFINVLEQFVQSVIIHE